MNVEHKIIDKSSGRCVATCISLETIRQIQAENPGRYFVIPADKRVELQSCPRDRSG